MKQLFKESAGDALDIEIKVEPNLIDTPEQLQTLVDLIDKKDINTVKGKFNNRAAIVDKSLLEWETDTHEIMNRQDKVLDDGTKVHQWKLALSYQKKIVQSAMAFLFGKPVKIKQESTGTDDIYDTLMKLRKQMRMPSKDQENCRYMKSETESAKLFVPFRNGEMLKEDLAKAGLVSVKCILLSKSQGDELYTLFDQYKVLQAFGRGYKTKEDDKEIDHFDIYTAEWLYYCVNRSGSWDVDKQKNLIGKIPVVYYSQDQSEWHDVQPLIYRRETLTSKRADNNDYSGDAILVVEGEAQSLPDKKDTGKVVQVSTGGKVYYLYPQMAIDLVKDEKEDLKYLIHYLTDTPDLSMENMATMGQDSGKALEMRFFGALLKAMGQYEYFQEMIDRENSILKAFIGKVIDISKANQVDKLELSYEFGNPLPDNFADLVDMLSTATGGKPIMSQQTAVEQNPLITDAVSENEKLKEENISSNPADI